MRVRSAATLLAVLLMACVGAPAPAAQERHQPPVLSINSASEVTHRQAASAIPLPLTTSPAHVPSFTGLPIAQLAGRDDPASPQMPIFRGDTRSKPSIAPGRGGATPSAPATPSTPSIGVYGSLNTRGLSSIDNGGSQIAPPDSTGAIGPNYYVEMVNSEIAVWNRSNLTLVSKSSLLNFVGLTNSYCDPQVQWDPAANRWLFVVLACNSNPSDQFFAFGWSMTSDPSTIAFGWCKY